MSTLNNRVEFFDKDLTIKIPFDQVAYDAGYAQGKLDAHSAVEKQRIEVIQECTRQFGEVSRKRQEMNDGLKQEVLSVIKSIAGHFVPVYVSAFPEESLQMWVDKIMHHLRCIEHVEVRIHSDMQMCLEKIFQQAQLKDLLVEWHCDDTLALTDVFIDSKDAHMSRSLKSMLDTVVL